MAGGLGGVGWGVAVCVSGSSAQSDSQKTEEAVDHRQNNSYVNLMGTSSVPTVQELCESRGGRPGLSVLTCLLVSVDVKNYWSVLRHWSRLVPNMSTDI